MNPAIVTPVARTLASYLADLSHDELTHMQSDIRQARGRLEDEVRSLEFEEDLVTQALSRKSRRASSPATANRVTRQQVLAMVRRNFQGPFNGPEAVKAFEGEGVTIAAESLRQHLRKLVSEGHLGRDGLAYTPGRASASSPASNGHGPATSTSPNGATQRGEDHEPSLEAGSRQGAEIAL